MKISQTDSIMKLNDYNLTQFVAGLVFLGMGLAVAYLAMDEIAVMLFGLIFAFIGLALFATNKIVSINLDRGLGIAKFSLASIVKRESKEVPIRQIKSLILEKSMIRSSKGGSRRQFSIVFVMEDSSRLEFEFGTMSGGLDSFLSPDEKMREKAQPVADFLGVPMKLEGPPSVNEAISSVKEAIEKRMNTDKL